ncbi:hypothetical protein, partial [Escherichia coli]|uniref:hypothetical protein n=1 Tax=Escherichia coli TaxID=562 RepID=UPI003CF06509
VAPHAGAWIETSATGAGVSSGAVAPHAGAWIETLIATSAVAPRWSPPTRGRGSKHRDLQADLPCAQVAPHAGAWIETDW